MSISTPFTGSSSNDFVIPFPISHFPIKYHLPFTKPSNIWLMANNLANGNWLMVYFAEKGKL